MKKKFWITFDAEPIPGEAGTILVPTNCGPDVVEIHDYTVVGVRTIRVHVKLEQTDPRVAKVLALLQQHNIEADVTTFTEYSDEDLQNARLLLMWPEPQARFFGGPRSGTKYDLTNACPNCHTGAQQTSPLYVEPEAPKMIRKHRALMAYSGEIIIDGGMRKKLVDGGVTGISFGDVRLRHENKKWSELARDQILIKHVLPPMRGELKPEDEKQLCKVCRRGGRMFVTEIPYRQEDLVDIKDFNCTWEWYGDFGLAVDGFYHLANPYTCVTPKVMNIFNKAGAKAFRWIPVNVAP